MAVRKLPSATGRPAEQTRWEVIYGQRADCRHAVSDRDLASGLSGVESLNDCLLAGECPWHGAATNLGGSCGSSAVFALLIGLSIGTATRWASIAGASWNSYVALPR